MELTGRVIAVLPANSGVSQRTGNSWMSQEYVIEVPGQYPRKCLFRIFGEDRIRIVYRMDLGIDQQQMYALLHQFTHQADMVRMIMCRQDPGDICHPDPVCLDRFIKSRQRTGKIRVDQQTARIPLDKISIGVPVFQDRDPFILSAHVTAAFPKTSPGCGPDLPIFLLYTAPFRAAG